MVLDELISEFDRGLRSMAGVNRMSRPVPAPAEPPAAELSAAERTHVAGLMRVNHVGEICAQALYQAQKLTDEHIKRIDEALATKEKEILQV